MTLDVYDRLDWGADPQLPRMGHLVPTAQFVGLVIHHTVMVLADTDHDGYTAGDDDDIFAYMRRLQVARPDLGLDVPYSFVVFEGATAADAVICVGRGEFRTGAHTAGFNSTRWGVALAGDYTNLTPTVGMVDAIRRIGWWLDDPYGALPTIGHRDTVATACPGDSAYPLLPYLQPPFDIDDEDDEMTPENYCKMRDPAYGTPDAIYRVTGGVIQIRLADGNWYWLAHYDQHLHTEASRR